MKYCNTEACFPGAPERELTMARTQPSPVVPSGCAGMEVGETETRQRCSFFFFLSVAR